MSQIAKLCHEHDIRRLVFARFELHPHRFRPPHDLNTEKGRKSYDVMCQDYFRGLRGFDPKAIAEGMHRIADEFQPKRWPTIEELRVIFIEEQRQLFPRKDEPKPRPWEQPEPSAEELERKRRENIEAMHRRDAEDRAAGIEPLGGGGKLPHQCTRKEIDAYNARVIQAIAEANQRALEAKFGKANAA